MTTCFSCFGTFGYLMDIPGYLNLKTSPILDGIYQENHDVPLPHDFNQNVSFNAWKIEFCPLGGFRFGRYYLSEEKKMWHFSGSLCHRPWEKSSWALFFIQASWSRTWIRMFLRTIRNSSLSNANEAFCLEHWSAMERKSSPFPKVGGEACSAHPSFIIYHGWLTFPIRVPLQNFGQRLWVETMIYCRKTGSDDWISHKKESAEEIVHTPTEKHPGCFGITCSDLLKMLGKSSFQTYSPNW